MSADTGEFAAIRDQVDGMRAEVAQTELYLAQTVDLVSSLLRELAPAVAHATSRQRQPQPRGRHRRTPVGRPLRHCRDVP